MFDPVFILKITVPLLWLALLSVFERRYAALLRNRLYGLARIGKNLGLWLINSGLSPLVILPLTALAAAHPLWRIDDSLALMAVPIHLILLDMWIYFWHRVNHQWRWLWRFHKIHHLDEALDATTALRFHFGEVVLSALVRMPVIMVLAAPLSTVILFEALLLCATLFHHSNWRLSAAAEYILSRLIITPELHRIHHHNITKDTDSNYGTIFSFWDRLFRTRNHYRVPPDHIIGAQGARDQPLMRLITLPFTAKT